MPTKRLCNGAGMSQIELEAAMLAGARMAAQPACAMRCHTERSKRGTASRSCLMRVSGDSVMSSAFALCAKACRESASYEADCVKDSGAFMAGNRSGQWEMGAAYRFAMQSMTRRTL